MKLDDARRKAARLARAAEPAGVSTIREAFAFARDHGLPISRRAQPQAYRTAQQFGLDLLPTGLRLDGLVVDVGANIGEFTAAVLSLEPRARVLAIEPGLAPRDQLEQRFAGDPRVRIDRRAASDTVGTATFQTTEMSEFGSLLQPHPKIVETYSGLAAVTGSTTVETVPLDDMIDEPVRLLKADVQGAEMAFLQGAEDTLAQTDAVLLEVTFVSHYDGDATFGVLHDRMQELGFQLSGISPPLTHEGLALWSDACYVPRRQVHAAQGAGQSSLPGRA